MYARLISIVCLFGMAAGAQAKDLTGLLAKKNDSLTGFQDQIATAKDNAGNEEIGFAHSVDNEFHGGYLDYRAGGNAGVANVARSDKFGNVTFDSFQIPTLDGHMPDKVSVHESGNGLTVVRQKGDVTLEQSYEASGFEWQGTRLAVLRNETVKVDGKEFHVEPNADRTGFSLTIQGLSLKSGMFKLPAGHVLDMRLAPNGSEVEVYSLRNGEVDRRVLAIGEGDANEVSLTEKSSARLTANEAKKALLRAQRKVVKGIQVSSGETAGGLVIEDTSAAKGVSESLFDAPYF